jgi:diguanylate cyclase
LQASNQNTKERLAVYQCLQQQIDEAINDNRQIGILLIKLQDFGDLEAVIGFYSLELITKRIQARLLTIAKDHRSVIQLSLDCFIVVVPKMLNIGHLKIVAESLSRTIRNAVKIENESIELKSSIGIAASSDSENNGQLIYENALIAMQRSYSDGSHCKAFEKTFREQMKKDWDLKKDIETAIKSNQFELYLQPKVRLNSMKVTGAEALIRWNHPQHGFVAPASFIPIAEQSGQIQSITNWVIKSAIQQLSDILKNIPDFNLSLNISVNNLGSPDLVYLLQDTLSIWDVPAENLTVEVTETAVMSDQKSSLERLAQIRELGVNISIDDFGTGYSSLAYFKHIPANELKIDRSFIDNVLHDPQDKNIVALIIFLAKQFDLNVVAEGVETKASVEEIAALECDYAQGYYFSKPLPYHEFIEWMNHFNNS